MRDLLLPSVKLKYLPNCSQTLLRFSSIACHWAGVFTSCPVNSSGCFNSNEGDNPQGRTAIALTENFRIHLDNRHITEC